MGTQQSKSMIGRKPTLVAQPASQSSGRKEEEKKVRVKKSKDDRSSIPQAVYQKVQDAKAMLENAEKLYHAGDYKRALACYKEGCSKMLTVAEQKELPGFYREELRDIATLAMKKAHLCKEAVHAMQPSSASPPSSFASLPEDVKAKALEERKKKEALLKRVSPSHIQSIEQNILDSSVGVAFTDICGQQESKEAIRAHIIQPLLRPDLYKGILSPAKGILLYGPPGNGKTMLAKAVASEVRATFFNISASTLVSRWLGEGEKLMRALFVVAAVKAPSIIFIDEIDSILTSRSQNEHEASRRLKTQFFLQLDGCASGDLGDNVLVMGATNRPWELDEAASRRFARKILVDVPDAKGRVQMIQMNLKDCNSRISKSEFIKLAEATEGYSNADLKNLVKEAAMGVVAEIPQGDLMRIQRSELRPVVIEDFRRALGVIRASVKRETIDFLRKWGSKKA